MTFNDLNLYGRGIQVLNKAIDVPTDTKRKAFKLGKWLNNSIEEYTSLVENKTENVDSLEVSEIPEIKFNIEELFEIPSLNGEMIRGLEKLNFVEEV